MAAYAAHLTRTLQGTPSVFQVTAQEALGATVKPALKRFVEVCIKSFACEDRTSISQKLYHWIGLLNPLLLTFFCNICFSPMFIIASICTNTIYFQYLAAVYPNKCGWCLKWFDELYLVFDCALQYYYLKHYGNYVPIITSLSLARPCKIPPSLINTGSEIYLLLSIYSRMSLRNECTVLTAYLSV